MNDLIRFEYEAKEVRVVKDTNGEPWWVAKDVCEVLEIEKYRDVVDRLEDDERGLVKVDTLGGPQEMISISESGLYTLIIRSNKPEAKPFRRWVTHEVLPQIRKTGRYEAPNREIDSLLISTRHMECISRYARAVVMLGTVFGLKRRTAVGVANRIIREETGTDCLKLLGAPWLGEEDVKFDESPIVRFVRERCLIGEDYNIHPPALFRRYLAWCAENGVMPGGKQGFYKQVLANFSVKRGRMHGATVETFFGLGMWKEEGGEEHAEIQNS